MSSFKLILALFKLTAVSFLPTIVVAAMPATATGHCTLHGEAWIVERPRTRSCPVAGTVARSWRTERSLVTSLMRHGCLLSRRIIGTGYILVVTFVVR